MKVTCFDINKSVVAANQGFFTVTDKWKHKNINQEDAWEIIIVVEGILFLQIGLNRVSVHNGDVLLVPAHTTVVGYRDSPLGTKYYWFHFFPNHDVYTSDTNVLDTSAGIPSNEILLPDIFHPKDLSKALVLCNQVLDIAINKEYPPIAVDYLITSLLIELSTCFLTTELQGKANKIDLIKGWIRSNLSSSLTVTDVADQFEFNTNYFERIFKQQTGITVKQYINSLKLNIAKNLLVTTNIPIKQVAARAYFNDDHHFMKQFKKSFNLTPTEFRVSYLNKFQDSNTFDPDVPLSKKINNNYQKRFN